MEERLNPQINTIEIGIKDIAIRTITPMSFNQQTKFGRLIASIIGNVAAVSEEVNNIKFATALISEIQKEIPAILKLCSDITKHDFEDNMTNAQILTAIQIIYEVNYGCVVKNGLDLFQKIQETWNWKGSLPQSANTIPTP